MPIPLVLANFAMEPIPPNGIVVPLQDNDVIVLIPYNRPDPSVVGLRLQTKNGMWFKGIEVHGGGQVSKLEVGDGGAVTQELALSQHTLGGTTLLFLKAKAFGVHTAMYELPATELAPLLGRGVVFDWRQD